MGCLYLAQPLAYGLILTSIPWRSRSRMYVFVPDFSFPMGCPLANPRSVHAMLQSMTEGFVSLHFILDFWSQYLI